MKANLAQRAVDQKEVYGRWQVEARVEGSVRKVLARCLDCDNIYQVDLYGLRRKDRNNTRCQSCSNKLISANNRLAPGESLVRNKLHFYKKSASVRGYSWELSLENFQNLIFEDCNYCGKPPTQITENSWDSILTNGIDRVDNSLGYTPKNSVACCSDCNYAKRNMSAEEYIDLCRRVTEKNDSGSNRA